MSQSDVEQFISITGVKRDEALSWITMANGDLSAAVDLHFASNSNDNRKETPSFYDTDEVRAPLPSKKMRLVDNPPVLPLCETKFFPSACLLTSLRTKIEYSATRRPETVFNRGITQNIVDGAIFILFPRSMQQQILHACMTREAKKSNHLRRCSETQMTSCGMAHSRM